MPDDRQTVLNLSGPGSAEECFERGLKLERRRPREAVAAYQQAIQIQPEHVDAHLNLGRLLQGDGGAGEAAAHYKRALELDPRHATAAYNLGTAYEDLNDATRAIRAYRKAIAADPAFADAHFNLGRLYEKAGRKRDALKQMRMYRNLR